MMTILVLGITVLDWAHESEELSRDDPVEVTVLNPLVVFVLLHVERSEVIPPKSHCVLQSLQTVEQGAVVETVSFGCISEVPE